MLHYILNYKIHTSNKWKSGLFSSGGNTTG